MRKLLVAGAVAAAALMVSGCGGATQGFAARVNGETISQESFLATVEAIGASSGGAEMKGSIPNSFDSQPVSEMLQSEIMGLIAKQEAERRSLPIDLEGARASFAEGQNAREFLALPEMVREQIVRRAAAFDVLQTSIAEAGITEPDDETVREAFEADPEQFRQVCLKLLVAFDRAQVDVARQRIAAGEDFGAVSASVSPEGAIPGDPGAVRCLPTRAISQQVPEFAEAIEAAEPGTLLEPVDAGQGQGFLLAVLTEKREPSLEGAKAFMAEQLASNPQAAVELELNRIMRSADVEVNPRFGTWTGEAVVPPSGPQVTGEEELPGTAAPGDAILPVPGALSPEEIPPVDMAPGEVELPPGEVPPGVSSE